MLVDDDLESLLEMKDVLLFNEYDVEIVLNSAVAFERACEIMPDLIITDLQMKPKSGFQLADELQNSFKTKAIPIIAITGFFTEKEHVLMMKMFGMRLTILKPVNPVDIVTKIEVVLKESRMNTITHTAS